MKVVLFYARYDPQTNRWTKVASMCTRRLGVGVAVLGGYLYAVGGSDGTSPLNTGNMCVCVSLCVAILLLMNILCTDWTYSHAEVYFLSSPFPCYLNTSVERYDPRTNRWTPVAPMCTRRKHLGVAVFNGTIFAVGGRDDATELSSAEKYSPANNAWQPIVAMTSRRSGVCTVVSYCLVFYSEVTFSLDTSSLITVFFLWF